MGPFSPEVARCKRLHYRLKKRPQLRGLRTGNRLPYGSRRAQSRQEVAVVQALAARPVWYHMAERRVKQFFLHPEAPV